LSITVLVEGKTERAFKPHLLEFQPEAINHEHPPSDRIREIFRLGRRRDYIKSRDANRILTGKELTVAANKCPELKAFLNTILTLTDANPI
jgi:hypothetical protein